MARLARVVVPGCPHHVTQRGNRRCDVFWDPNDRGECCLLASAAWPSPADSSCPKSPPESQRTLNPKAKGNHMPPDPGKEPKCVVCPEWHEDKHGSPPPSPEGLLKDASRSIQEIVLFGSPFHGSRLDSIGAVRQLVLRDPPQQQVPQGPAPFGSPQEPQVRGDGVHSVHRARQAQPMQRATVPAGGLPHQPANQA